MPSECAAPIFKTCGTSFSLRGVDLPDSVRVFNTVPENLCDFEKMRREGKMCDATIRVGDKKLSCHKELLSARIPFFHSLFNSNMAECASGDIKLSTNFSEFDLATIESLLEFAYTGCLPISIDNAQALMMGAVYLGMESAMDECARFMRKRLTVDNALSMLFFFREIKYHKVDEYVLKFIDKNFVIISLSPEFLKLSAADLEFFVQRDSLYVDSEEQVFKAVSRWIGDNAERVQHAARLLQCIRCTLLSLTFISETIEKAVWVMGNTDCKALVDKAKEYIANKSTQNGILHSERSCDDGHRLIFCRGKKSMQIYDPITNTWTKCSLMPEKKSEHIQMAVDQKTFIHAAGTNPYSEELSFLDCATNEWHLIPCPPNKRSLTTRSVINGKVYVIGGYGRDLQFPQSSVEVYNSSSKEWSTIAPMSKVRVCADSCVLRGKLYVIGGHYFPQFWNDGECYDPETGSGTPMRAMSTGRCGFAAAALNGHIYAVGGYDGTKAIKDVERYDPVTDTWTTLKDINVGRALSTSAVSCGKLFVFCGFNSVGRTNVLTDINSSGEMYHPDTNTWEEIKGMDEHSFDVGIIPIPACIPSPVDNLECFFRDFNLKEELLKAIEDSEFAHSLQGKDEIHVNVNVN